MPQGRSHAGTFMPLLHRLVEDGHNVTVYFDIYRPELPLGGGVEENLVLIKGLDLSIDNDAEFANMVWNGEVGVVGGLFPFYPSSLSCQHLLKHQANDFWRLANQSWDLVLTDSLFAPCGYAIALNNGKPAVIMHATDLENVFAYYSSYGRNPVLSPPLFLYDTMEWNISNFYDRYTSIRDAVKSLMLVDFAISNLIRWTIRSIGDFTFSEYVGQAAFSFYDFPHSIGWTVPLANDIISYGMSCKKPKPLTGKYAKFVSDPKSRGTILIAFGTITNWDFAPKRVVDAIVGALNELTDYRIIWGYKGPKLDVKDHIMLDEWLPQFDILSDPRTKLFISHGGLKSMKEAICSETPVVYVPLFAEQVRNAWLAKTHSFAEVIDKKTLTAGSVERNIRKVIEDDSYSKAVKRVRSIFDDRPISSLDDGSFWVQRLLKYNGKLPGYFYRTSARNSIFHHFYMDIGILILVSFCFVAFQK
uniref:UDP-glucuronosyltransferase n=1 Tax=Plectus sambesii TaxID=2011161 RepID=A0A914UU39_9BILA